ncbi:MAG: flagellar basal body-associated FliL family protein, partial [Gammaproteobacteria bacterium]
VKGKEKLRKDALLAIQKVLKENTGTEGVSELYFTGFIIQ